MGIDYVTECIFDVMRACQTLTGMALAERLEILKKEYDEKTVWDIYREIAGTRNKTA